MRAQELKAWLLGPNEPSISPAEIAAPGGGDPGPSRGATRRSLRFVLAALRDTYADDLDVWLWFLRPRRDLRGARPVDLLLAGRIAELESLAVHDWNVHAGDDPRAAAVAAAPSPSPAGTFRRRPLARRP